jgi:hypothetical protein
VQRGFCLSVFLDGWYGVDWSRPEQTIGLGHENSNNRSRMEVTMNMPETLTWRFKDSNGRDWEARASPTGEVVNQHDEYNPDGDCQWRCEMFGYDGFRIWYGYHVGQLDRPPKLRDLLFEWQQEVNQIVLDGAIDETRKRFPNANE